VRSRTSALWWMHRLGVDGSLSGDIVEQYGTGRSRLWLWRQAVIAVVNQTAMDAWRHKVATLSQITLGWWVLWICTKFVATLSTQLGVGALIDVKFWWWTHIGIPVEPWAVYVLAGIWGMCSGWTVARFNRGSRPSILLAFIASYLMWTLWWTLRLVLRVLQDPHGYSVFEWAMVITQVIAATMLVPVGIMVGGLWRHDRRKPADLYREAD
jgi:hypothetical protein